MSVTLVVLVLAAVGTALFGNDLRIEERRVTVPAPGGSLDGVLTLPQDGPARGLVVMVHGDGAVDATQDGLYRPWFEAAADAGFATLSWSKPGVGDSTGGWLTQTMDDRAREVSAAIDWAESSPDVPTGSIVLWGASQAGWVLPKVVAARNDVAGVVAAGPAINWLRQGRYNTLAELAEQGAGPDERTRAVAQSDRTRALLEQPDGYPAYLASTTDAEPMGPQRWEFVRRNMDSDATADLQASSPGHVPVLLMLGEHDRNVDVREAETVYRRILGADVTVFHADAVHSLARPVVEDHELVGLTTAVLWPRALLADGVLDAYRHFLRSR